MLFELFDLTFIILVIENYLESFTRIYDFLLLQFLCELKERSRDEGLRIAQLLKIRKSKERFFFKPLKSKMFTRRNFNIEFHDSFTHWKIADISKWMTSMVALCAHPMLWSETSLLCSTWTKSNRNTTSPSHVCLFCTYLLNSWMPIAKNARF